MGEQSPENADEVKPKSASSTSTQRSQSVKFKTARQPPLQNISKVTIVKAEDTTETLKPEGSPLVNVSTIEKDTPETGSPDILENAECDDSPKTTEDSRSCQGSSESSQDRKHRLAEALSTSRASSRVTASIAGAASRSSRSVLAEAEFTVAEDGNIHINEEQKAAIRRLIHPEQEEKHHLGFTKQGKPIKANPYYKYVLRTKDSSEVSRPAPPPVTEPHTSRLTRRSRRDISPLPTGPSTVLEQIKEEFCAWLASLGSGRHLTVSGERLEELFSLGLENNLVVRPPEVRMGQPGRRRDPAGAGTAQRTSRLPQRRQPGEDSDRRRPKAGAAAVFCRSPSVTYYPELRQRWRQRALRQRRPLWRAAPHGPAPPPPPRVRYGDWYIPVCRWRRLEAGHRLTPPETEQARQLRQGQLANRRLNQSLARSHAVSALREYLQLRRLRGDPALPEATPQLVRDVEALPAEWRGPEPPGRPPSPPVAALVLRAPETAQRSVSARRPAVAPVRELLMARPPPMYRPLKTEPGQAARRHGRTATVR